MGVSHQRLHNDNLKEEILKDQVERLEHENTERSRLLGKIDQVMMKSEAGGALGPYMDYITKLKEENTRLKIVEKEREFLKQEIQIMGGEVAKIHQMELAFDMEICEGQTDNAIEANDRKMKIETTSAKNSALQRGKYIFFSRSNRDRCLSGEKIWIVEDSEWIRPGFLFEVNFDRK
jgi:hypothetical protein